MSHIWGLLCQLCMCLLCFLSVSGSLLKAATPPTINRLAELTAASLRQSVVLLNDDNFDDFVTATPLQYSVFVFMTTMTDEACPSCQEKEKYFKSVADEYYESLLPVDSSKRGSRRVPEASHGHVFFVKIYADDSPRIAGEYHNPKLPLLFFINEKDTLPVPHAPEKGSSRPLYRILSKDTYGAAITTARATRAQIQNWVRKSLGGYHEIPSKRGGGGGGGESTVAGGGFVLFPRALGLYYVAVVFVLCGILMKFGTDSHYVHAANAALVAVAAHSIYSDLSSAHNSLSTSIRVASLLLVAVVAYSLWQVQFPYYRKPGKNPLVNIYMQFHALQLDAYYKFIVPVVVGKCKWLYAYLMWHYGVELRYGRVYEREERTGTIRYTRKIDGMKLAMVFSALARDATPIVSGSPTHSRLLEIFEDDRDAEDGAKDNGPVNTELARLRVHAEVLRRRMEEVELSRARQPEAASVSAFRDSLRAHAVDAEGRVRTEGQFLKFIDRETCLLVRVEAGKGSPVDGKDTQNVLQIRSHDTPHPKFSAMYDHLYPLNVTDAAWDAASRAPPRNSNGSNKSSSSNSAEVCITDSDAFSVVIHCANEEMRIHGCLPSYSVLFLKAMVVNAVIARANANVYFLKVVKEALQQAREADPPGGVLDHLILKKGDKTALSSDDRMLTAYGVQPGARIYLTKRKLPGADASRFPEVAVLTPIPDVEVAEPAVDAILRTLLIDLQSKVFAGTKIGTGVSLGSLLSQLDAGLALYDSAVRSHASKPHDQTLAGEYLTTARTLLNSLAVDSSDARAVAIRARRQRTLDGLNHRLSALPLQPISPPVPPVPPLILPPRVVPAPIPQRREAPRPGPWLVPWPVAPPLTYNQLISDMASANKSNICTEENYYLLHWLYRIRRTSCARALHIGFLQPDFLFVIYGPMLRDKKLCRTNDDIRVAVDLWCSNRAAAEERYGHISDWDVSSVTDMIELFRGQVYGEPMEDRFRGKSEFNDDISRWNVSQVTDMSCMFAHAHSFNQPVGAWNMSKVINIWGMFQGARSFNQPVGSWDVSKVTDMEGMFHEAQSFNQPVKDWDVSNVTNMRYMFSDADLFNQAVGDWNVSKVTNMSHMFNMTRDFDQAVGGWDVSNVTKMQYMFWYASAFNQAVGNWDVSKVTNMQGMFANALSFNQSVGNWDVSNVTDMKSMFREARVFDQAVGNWDVSEVTSMESMFSGSYAFNQAVGDWNVSKVTNMRYMFWYAHVFNQAVGNWDVSQVTNMCHMFYGADAFNQAVSEWDVSTVTDMMSMFGNAHAFNQDLTRWDMRSVIDTSGMFYNAHAMQANNKPARCL